MKKLKNAVIKKIIVLALTVVMVTGSSYSAQNFIYAQEDQTEAFGEIPAETTQADVPAEPEGGNIQEEEPELSIEMPAQITEREPEVPAVEEEIQTEMTEPEAPVQEIPVQEPVTDGQASQETTTAQETTVQETSVQETTAPAEPLFTINERGEILLPWTDVNNGVNSLARIVVVPGTNDAAYLAGHDTEIALGAKAGSLSADEYAWIISENFEEKYELIRATEMTAIYAGKTDEWFPAEKMTVKMPVVTEDQSYSTDGVAYTNEYNLLRHEGRILSRKEEIEGLALIYIHKDISGAVYAEKTAFEYIDGYITFKAPGPGSFVFVMEEKEEGSSEEPASEEETSEEETSAEEVDETETEPETETASPDMPAFSQTITVDDVMISVNAEEGTFPADAILKAEKVTGLRDQRRVHDCLEDARDAETNVAASYTFDIKILDKDGNEIQPPEGKDVKVSFLTKENTNENLEASVYHIADGAAEAQALDIAVVDGTIIAETDGFSLYTVEFTYGALQYVLEGGATVALADILAYVGLTGTIEGVSVSDETLFSAYAENGVWYIQSHQSFISDEWMKVTLDGIEYEIVVTDAVGSAYAILTSGGGLILFRSTNTYTNGTANVTATDIDGNTYTGRIFADIETTNASGTSNSKWYSYRTSITSVRVATGQTISPVNTSYWFYSCTNMTSCDLTGLNTSAVTNMTCMFSGCRGLTSLDLSSFDTSAVTVMESMFYNCSGLTSLNLSSFDTSAVTNMGSMFYYCSGLTSLDLSSFDTSNVTSMNSMFYNCSGLTSLNLSSFDTSAVTNMGYMFYNCSGLTSLNLSSFDTSAVTNMGAMFYYCSGLTSLNLTGFDTSAVTNMGAMFYNCSGLTSLNLSSFDTSAVTSMGSIFYNCRGLTSLDLSSFDTSAVTSMVYMFYNCSGLTSLNLSSLDTSAVTDMLNMFYNCNALTSITLGSNFSFKGKGITATSNWAILPNRYTWIRNDHEYGPYTAPQLRDNYTSEMAGTWVYTDEAAYAILQDNGELILFRSSNTYTNDTANVTATDIDGNTYTGRIFADIETTKSSNTDNSKWYSYRTSITSVRVATGQTISPVSTACWFYNCSNVTSCDLTGLDTSAATNMGSMFYGCNALTSITLGSNFSFKGNGITTTSYWAILPGSFSWVRNDNAYGPYSTALLRDIYTSAMAGTWICTDEAAYAILQDNGELILFRSSNTYTNGTANVTATDINGNTYTGRIFAGIETTNASSSSNSKWYSYRTSITSVRVATGQTINPVSTAYWFYNCSNMTSCDLTGLDTFAVKNMGYMFSGCSGLTSLNLSSLDTSAVTNMGSMFYNCNALTSITLGANFSFKGNGITTASYWAVLPSSFSWARNDNAYGPYTPAQLRDNYTSAMAGTWINVGAAYAILQDNGELILFRSSNTYTNGTANVTATDINGNTYTGRIFAGIETTNTSSTSNSKWYSYCTSITSVRVATGQTISPVNTAYWFYNCSNMTSCDLTGLDTSAVKNMGYMFSGCSGLTSLDLSRFDTSAATNMGSMFYNCNALTSITLGANFSFKGNGITTAYYWAVLPGSFSWVRNDNAYGPYTPAQLRDNYTSAMAGTWINAGAAYAILQDNGELILFRSSNTYTNNTANVTATDVDGNTYTGRIFADIETTNTSGTGNSKWYSYGTSITSVRVATGQTISPVSTFYWFCNCSNMTSCDLTGLDTSAVTDMGYMFSGCSGLTSLNLTGFDTSAVTNMGSMFYGCSGLTSLNLTGFDTSAVTDMGTMFYNCRGLTSLDLSSFDTSAVTDMGGMFYGCNALTSITLGANFSFKGNGITTTSYCAVLPGINTWRRNDDLYGPYTPAQLRDNYTSAMAGTWMIDDLACAILQDDGALIMCHVKSPVESSLPYIATVNDIDGNTYTGRIFADIETTNASGTGNSKWYSYCTSITSVRVATGQTISPVSTASWFSGCTNMTSCDLTGLDTSAVTNMEFMFSGCSGLTSLDLSSLDTSAVTSMYRMFSGCSGLTSLNLTGFDTSAVTNMEFMFSGCSGLTSLNLTGFDTSAVTNMGYMFYGCSGLTSLSLSSFDTSAVTNMERMFYNCSGLTSLNLTGFDTSAVTNMESMFSGCSGLTSLSLSSFDTSAVTNMGSMFSGCSGLTSLNLTGFDTSAVTSMVYMFYNCSSLTNLNIEHFSISTSTRKSSMFTGCNSLATIILGANFTFVGNNYNEYAILPGNGWVRIDNVYGPYTPVQLRDNYTSAMAGTWIRNEAYAILQDDGELILFRSTEIYNDDTANVTATDVDGNIYIGRVFTGLETTQYNGWDDYKSLIKSANTVTGQTIIPYSPNELFRSCTSLITCNIADLDTSGFASTPYNMTGMFNGCTKLRELTLGINTWFYPSMNTAYYSPELRQASWRQVSTNNIYSTMQLLTKYNNAATREKATYIVITDVNFYANMGAFSDGSLTYTTYADESDEYTYDVDFVAPIEEPSRKGYSFNGWVDLTHMLMEHGSTTTSTDYYADWTPNTYTVILSANGGNGEDIAISAQTDTPVALSNTVFERQGYVLSSWNERRNGSGTSYSAPGEAFNITDIEGDTVILYAQWTPVSDYATVTFNTNGGSAIDPITLLKGEAIGNLPSPARSGYTFMHWHSGSVSGPVVTSSTIINNDTILVAEWSQHKNIQFYNGNTLVDTKTIPHGSNLGATPSMASPAADGRTFLGWSLNASYPENLDEELIMENQIITEDTILYAQWGWVPEFDANGGVITSGLNYDIQESPVYSFNSVPSATREGYSFAGWYWQDGTTQLNAGDTINLSTQNRVFTAKWTQTSPSITVTLNPNGGMFENSSQEALTVTIPSGTSLRGVLNTPIHRSYYEFVGWLGNDGVTYTGDETVNTDLILTAQWANAGNTIVYFDPADGYTGVSYLYTPSGTTLPYIPSATPYSERYKFEGWYTDYNGQGTKLTKDTIINSSATYYAYYVPYIQSGNTADAEYLFGANWTNEGNENVSNIDDNLSFRFTSADDAEAQLHIWFEVDQIVENGQPFPEGSVNIRIPKYIWKDWDGHDIGTCNIADVLPEYDPNDWSWSDFAYIDDGDSYILTNAYEIWDGFGFECFITYSVDCMDVPGGAMDTNYRIVPGYDYYDEDVDIILTTDSDLDGVDDTTDTVTLHTEMHTGTWVGVEKTALQNKDDENIYHYISWDPEWGTMPAAANNCFYVVWSVQVFGSWSQPFTVEYEDIPESGNIIKCSVSEDFSDNNAKLGSDNTTVYLLVAYPNSFLENLTSQGRTFRNDVFITTTSESGYISEAASKAYVNITRPPEPENHINKEFKEATVETAGAQNEILGDRPIDITWKLSYEGSYGSNPTLSNGTYTSANKTITITDGRPGDIMYNSARAKFPYAWVPATGNVDLADGDYYIKSLNIHMEESDAVPSSGENPAAQQNLDYSSYEQVYIYARYAHTSEFVLYATKNAAANTRVNFPDDQVVGWKLQYSTSFYHTKINAEEVVRLKPSEHIKSLISNDVTDGTDSIIKNKALFAVTVGNNTLFEYDVMLDDEDGGATEQSYRLSHSDYTQYAQKSAGTTISNLREGTQDTPIYIQGNNYKSGSLIVPLNSGIFYDLLPIGTTVDPDTVYGIPFTDNTTSAAYTGNSYSTYKNSNEKLEKTLYDVTFEYNWKGSGRTMMIIRFNLPDDKEYAGAGFFYYLHNTFENVIANGLSLENDVAFINTDGIYVPSTRYNLVTTMPSGMYDDLEEQYAPLISYAKTNISYIQVNAFSWGYHKYVQTGADRLKTATTYPNGDYNYILSYSQSTSATSKDIVFYDVLESGYNADVYGDIEFMESEWLGTLQYVDVTDAANKFTKDSTTIKCAPVVYYSTKARDEFTTADYDVSQSAVWSTEMPADKSTITAIAVDCSKNTDGTDFIFDGRQVMEIKLVMKAPAEAAKYDTYAYNPSIIYKLNVDLSGQKNRALEDESTKLTSNASIKLVNNEPELHKESDPVTGTYEEPTIVFKDTSLDYKLTVSNTGTEFPIKNIIVEDEIPTGLWFNANDITAAFGNDSPVVIEETPRISLTRTGQKVVFRIDSIDPGETVTLMIPTMVRVTGIRYVNTAYITEVDGIEKEIESETTYHESEDPEDSYTVTIRKENGLGQLIGGAQLQITGRGIYDTEDIEPITWTTVAGQPRVITLSPGNYVIHEISAPEGYLPADDIELYLTEDTVITMHDPDIREITVTKFWNDTGYEAMRPESVNVKLYRDGVFFQSFVISQATGWDYTLEVPDNAPDGHFYVYTVEEEIEGYYATYSSESDDHLMITNTKTVPLRGKKIWEDNSNASGNRPDSVTVNLYQNGVLYRTTTATEDTDWKYIFNDVPLRDENGDEYEYNIMEAPVSGYTTSYTSSHDRYYSVTLDYATGSNSSTYGDIYLYYIYNGSLYRTPAMTSSYTRTTTYTIPSNEFWIEYYNNYSYSHYGLRVTSVTAVDSLPSAPGTIVNGFTYPNATAIEAAAWTEIESPHNVSPSVVGATRWHYQYGISDSRIDNVITNVELPEETTHIRFKKVDPENNPVPNARLQLLRGADVVLEWYSEDHPTLFDGIEPGTYTLHEAAVPEGYRQAPDQTIVIEDTTELQTFTMVDPLRSAGHSIEVSKTVSGNMASRDNPFEFVLTIEPGTDTAGITFTKGSDSGEAVFTNGRYEFTLSHLETILFENVPDGVTYTVTEVKANKDGYTTTVSGDPATGTLTDDVSISFTNRREMAIPTDAYDNGILVYVIGCLIFLATVGILMIYTRKKQKR